MEKNNKINECFCGGGIPLLEGSNFESPDDFILICYQCYDYSFPANNIIKAINNWNMSY